MSRIRRHLTYANVMSTIALILALGGATFALAAITSSGPVVPFTRTSSACKPGPDVSGSIANVEHPSAPLKPCVTLTASLPRRERTLVLVSAGWYAAIVAQASYPTKGRCLLTVDGNQLSKSETRPGTQGADPGDTKRTQALVSQAVTGALAAGPHTFRLACAQIQGNFRLGRQTLTVVRAS